MTPIRFMLMGLMIAGLPTPAGAQNGDTVAIGPYASLGIESSPDSAMVYLNGRLAGRTPLHVDSLNAGLHHISLMHPDTKNWLTPTVADSVRLVPGGEKTLRFNLNGGITIRSFPEGAAVSVADSLIGRTPLTLLPGRWFPDTLLEIRKEGYEAVTVSPDRALRGVITVPLTKAWKSTAPDDTLLLTNGNSSGRALRLYITGGIGVLGSIASAYFKISADNRQEDYLMTGDPAILSERQRLDTAAGVSLAVTQASLVLFSYFLLDE